MVCLLLDFLQVLVYMFILNLISKVHLGDQF